MGKALACVRPGVVYPGHKLVPPEVCLGATDEVWIPAMGGASGMDLVCVTRDLRIRRNPVQRATLVSEQVRAIFLTGRNDLPPEALLSLLIRRKEAIAKAVRQSGPGPWAIGLSSVGKIDPIPLDQDE